MSHWIASVISSSPRHEGLSVSAASTIESSNRYTPTSARSLTNSFGFSTKRTTRSPSSTATPNRSGSRTRARKICASGRVRSNSSTNRLSPSSSTLSPRYIRNGWPATKSRAVRTACARPSGCSWGMYVTESPHGEPSPTAARISSRVSPTTIPTSMMPASRMASSAWNRIGAPATGISCFAFVCVSGRSRDPCPPARMSARIRLPRRCIRSCPHPCRPAGVGSHR